jgi:hypothetical protein
VPFSGSSERVDKDKLVLIGASKVTAPPGVSRDVVPSAGSRTTYDHDIYGHDLADQ